MNRRRLSSLVILTLAFGCGFDSVVSPDTGTLVIRLLWGVPAPSPANSIHLAPGDTTPGNTVDTLDAAWIHVIGPTTRTVQLTDAGDHFTGSVDNLSPGVYTVAAEGLMSGEVAYYGEAEQVRVVSGQSTNADVHLFTFQPRILELDSATTALQFPLTFSSVQHADAYVVELAANPEFLNASAHSASDTAVVVEVADTGSYFIRVRADNAIVSLPGRASETRIVEVVTDISASGDDVGTAAPLGFGVAANQTIREVNILPVGDSDWFAVDVCGLDTLIVETFAQRLAIPSDLSTYLQLLEPNGTTLVVDNDDIAGGTSIDSRIEPTVAEDGRYFIVVSAFQDGSVGA